MCFCGFLLKISYLPGIISVKEKTIDDKTCIFYSECESLVHLFLTDVSLFSYGLLLLKCWGFRLARTLSQWLSYGLTIRNLN
jgi:hypothetical protein